MKKLLIGILVLVVIVIAAAVVVPFFIPLDTVKAQITTRAEDATGRKLTIAGDFDLLILPRVRIKAGDVTFANAPGVKQANMLELAELEVGLSLFPLLTGRVELTSFVLIDPVINLEIDAKGRPNWQFKEKGSSGEAGRKSDSDSGDGGSKGLRDISLSDVRLVNGTVRFSNAQTGASQEIKSINAEINLPSLDRTLTAGGSLVWNGETIELTLQVDNPRALMEGASSGVQTAIKAAPVTLDYKGTVTNAKPVAVTGDITLNVPSIRKLAAWAGKPIEAAGGGLGPLSIKGTLDMAGKSVACRGAEISLDNMNAKGDFEVDTGGKVPSIVASLEVDKLDLNTYLPPESGKPAAAPSGGGPTPAVGGSSAGSGGPKDWSDDPIDFSALKLVDADLSFHTGGIFVKEIKVGRTALKTVLKSGKLTLELTEMALYGGQGTGRITVDAGRSTITQKLNLKGVQAEPLLTDAAGFDRVEGTANIVVDVKTRGTSQRKLVSALNGKGSIQFLNGAVRGINIGAMVRNISSAFLDSSARETQKTDYAELAGTYTIANGIIKNDDLFLKSPLLRVDGKGTVDLPKRTVDYRVTPKIVASAKGQGGTDQLTGLAVPVLITGPWDNLSYAPDLVGVVDELIKDPESVLDTIKNLIPGLGSSGDSSTTSDNPLDSTMKLFGR